MINYKCMHKWIWLTENDCCQKNQHDKQKNENINSEKESTESWELLGDKKDTYVCKIKEIQNHINQNGRKKGKGQLTTSSCLALAKIWLLEWLMSVMGKADTLCVPFLSLTQPRVYFWRRVIVCELRRMKIKFHESINQPAGLALSPWAVDVKSHGKSQMLQESTPSIQEAQLFLVWRRRKLSQMP